LPDTQIWTLSVFGRIAAVPSSFARQKLAEHKVPKTIRVVDQVPGGPNGNADYSAARILFG
jgi:acyl-CoA synthetase (AMP-forming)/AMP-acid ligase II